MTLLAASYKSPTGSTHAFLYESVSRQVTTRGTAFEFPGVDGAYVQQTGFGARRYPLACIFNGPTHDAAATAFEAALLETGTGRLTHPIYGLVDVVPFGDIARRDDPVREANQSVVDVTFWTTLAVLFPAGVIDPTNEIAAALATFDTAAATEFSESTDLRSQISKTHERTSVLDYVSTVNTALIDAASATASVRRSFVTQQQKITFGIDGLLIAPVQLANEIAKLVRLPSSASSAVLSRLDSFSDLFDSVVTGSVTSRQINSANLPSLRLAQVNQLRTGDLVAMCAVSGSVAAVVATEFASRGATLAAADRVLAQHDALVVWREAAFADLDQVDTGGAYQALQSAVALVVGYLIQVSFVLPPERRIRLTRPRTIVDLAAELYGTVDDRLDLLISSNNLSGAEVLEIPAGRLIVYY